MTFKHKNKNIVELVNKQNKHQIAHSKKKQQKHHIIKQFSKAEVVKNFENKDTIHKNKVGRMIHLENTKEVKWTSHKC